jgi:hypothetical protein
MAKPWNGLDKKSELKNGLENAPIDHVGKSGGGRY